MDTVAAYPERSNSLGEGFTHANKSHELGEETINTLFHNDMLKIFDNSELRKLGVELLNLQKSTPKRKAKDDFADALRYCCVGVPWNFEGIEGREMFIEAAKDKEPRQMTEKELMDQQIRHR